MDVTHFIVNQGKAKTDQVTRSELVNPDEGNEVLKVLAPYLLEFDEPDDIGEFILRRDARRDLGYGDYILAATAHDAVLRGQW